MSDLQSLKARVKIRRELGQQFNAYESDDGLNWIVGIGPVTNFLGFANCRTQEAADLVVSGLRALASQDSTRGEVA